MLNIEINSKLLKNCNQRYKRMQEFSMGCTTKKIGLILTLKKKKNISKISIDIKTQVLCITNKFLCFATNR